MQVNGLPQGWWIKFRGQKLVWLGSRGGAGLLFRGPGWQVEEEFVAWLDVQGSWMESEGRAAAWMAVQVFGWKGEEELPSGWLCRVLGWKGEEELPP